MRNVTTSSHSFSVMRFFQKNPTRLTPCESSRELKLQEGLRDNKYFASEHFARLTNRTSKHLDHTSGLYCEAAENEGEAPREETTVAELVMLLKVANVALLVSRLVSLVSEVCRGIHRKLHITGALQRNLKHVSSDRTTQKLLDCGSVFWNEQIAFNVMDYKQNCIFVMNNQFQSATSLQSRKRGFHIPQPRSASVVLRDGKHEGQCMRRNFNASFRRDLTGEGSVGECLLFGKLFAVSLLVSLMLYITVHHFLWLVRLLEKSSQNASLSELTCEPQRAEENSFVPRTFSALTSLLEDFNHNQHLMASLLAGGLCALRF